MAKSEMEGHAEFGLPDPSTVSPSQKAVIFPGTGNFINLREASKPSARAAPATPAPGSGVTLNFEGASIRDVVKVVFDTLKENYVIDPQVQGEVTVQTSRPLAQDQLLPTLEILLRESNAVLVREGNVYRIIPAAIALRQGNLTPRLSRGRVGYGVRIVPLRYISAIEMQTIIAPFLPEGGILKADSTRNLLVLAGTSQELNSVQDTIETFDVNWLRGMSIGMFRLRNIDSQSVATELNQLLGEGSGTPIAGLVRLVPLSKLNSVLVISPQREYLREVAIWIERLDGIGGERLYVYPIQNSRADYVAELLNGLFNLSGGDSTRGGELAPGLRGAQLSSGSSGSSAGLSGGKTSSLSGGTSSLSGGTSSLSGGASSSGGLSSLGNLTASAGNRSGSNSSGSGIGALGSGGPSAGMEEVRIVADADNNALLIWATSQNYERIVTTLQKIDVAPRQVLIEATIAEVTLTGNLQYGLQWFFNNEVGKNYTGTGSLGLPADYTLTNALKSIPTGQFSYAITDSNDIVKTLLTALASDSKVKVLSSPQVMVVDNQQATIRVGTQQPVPTGTSTVNNVTTTGGVTYKDTGVFLEVLPRVNSGGIVNMEIKQEVIDVGPLVDVSQAGSTAQQERAFLQRSVTSKVTVKSGQTLVLGGLIRDNRTEGQSGIPVLYKVPVIGALFGNTTEEVDRTELIVLITPRVVQSTEEIDAVTDEIKRKMRAVEAIIPAS
ncbi:MAG TPA: type II secretion system secretin GspD [Candidatus Competibacteraceae bacterium]|nr:type II secretion system secretin GspD [Candidatus Competibacteraceae bacterium]HRY17062.1 type II secretion system secretin GspD [Candidatus Competibacteraceae bacterium]